jgi:hypothetical protein
VCCKVYGSSDGVVLLGGGEPAGRLSGWQCQVLQTVSHKLSGCYALTGNQSLVSEGAMVKSSFTKGRCPERDHLQCAPLPNINTI